MNISMVNEEQGEGQHGGDVSDGAFDVASDDIDIDRGYIDEGNVDGDNAVAAADDDDDDDESQISMIDDDALIARLSDEEDSDESDDDDDESDDDESSMDDGDLHYCTYKGSRTKILQELTTPLERRLVFQKVMTKKPELFQILRDKIDRIVSIPTTTCTTGSRTTSTGTRCPISSNDDCGGGGGGGVHNDDCCDIDIDDSMVVDYLSKIYRILKMSLFHHSNNDVRINVLRDTFQQVATSIRLFPYVLTETYRGLLPIAWQFGNCVKTTPYIILFAQLGVEYTPQLFTKEQRGGLVMNNYNVIKGACCNERYFQPTNSDYQHKVDTKRLEVLMSLREHNLMVPTDIGKYSLLETVINEKMFATQRFTYLVEWDPTLLSKPVIAAATTTLLPVPDTLCTGSNTTTTSMILPLHLASIKLTSLSSLAVPSTTTAATAAATATATASYTTIEMFRTIFELGYKHYPKEMGFLFYTTTMNNSGDNKSVEEARKFVKNSSATKVMEIIDDIIVQCRNRQLQNESTTTTTTTTTTANKSSMVVDDTTTTATGTTYTLSHSQLIHAMMNDSVHMEGVYRLIRNDPSIVQQLLLVRELSPSPSQQQPFQKQSSLVALSQSKQPPSSSSLVSLQSQSSSSSSSTLSSTPSNNNQQEEEEEVVPTGTRVCVCRCDGNNTNNNKSNDANDEANNDDNDTTTTPDHYQHHHNNNNNKRRRVQV
eukprot:CAMPEP_0170824332 /NCGR_PEP_ID=MMETSP0733-20121128/45236_1 /TAXON_ID=186038 /ORGANISM="Fragilariopsis kerguelensis, Strain L26-C5" /LENGTH=711 /DNA_ID=CAMNT_0011187551 /DNA_START=28 /DNA_END=2163 /DNA_ORIENTATION=+